MRFPGIVFTWFS